MAKVDTYPAWTASGVKVTSSVGDAPAGVRFEWPDGRALFTDLPEQGMYLDACDFEGQPVAIVQGHDSELAYLVRPTGWERLDKTHGIRAGAINIVAGQLRWVFVHNTSKYIDTGHVKPLPPDQLQTSQGILALESDGRINWAAPPDRVESGLYHKVDTVGASAGLLAAVDQLAVLAPEPHTVFNGLCHNIRIIKRDDGQYGVCARAQDGSALFHIGPPWPDFIDPATQLPPLDSVPLLGRPFGVACYCFNNAETLGNLTLMIRPTILTSGPATEFIATVDDDHLIHNEVLWAVYSGNVNSAADIQAARAVGKRRQRGLVIYQDAYPMRGSVMDLAEPGDLLTPQVYRDQGEDIGHYRMRLRTAFADAAVVGEPWPTVNIHQRYSGTTPTLSVREVVEGFVTACQVAQEQGWPGMLLFRVGTPDVPEEIYPYIERFMSGITGMPDARVLDDDTNEPEEPEDMNVYLLVTPAAAPAPNKVPEPGNTKLLGARENLPDGGFAIKKPNGKYATLTPSKTWEERDAVGGDWEKFYDGKPGFILAPRRDDRCFTLEAVQGP